MIDKENIILVPGTIQYVKNYESYKGLDIWIGVQNKEAISSAKCFIGHSLGASYVLNLNIEPGKRFIFINPLVKKRNILNLFVRWMKFHIFEGIKGEKVVPVKCWTHTFKQVLFLLKVDVLREMQKIPRGDVVVIRGRQDSFFCDEEDIEILNKNSFKVVEVEAGHDWNENVAKVVEDLIKN
jgi:hypothetical protein